MIGWHNSIVVGPRARRRERVLVAQSRYRSLQLSLNWIGSATERGPDGHISMQRWEEEFTDHPGRVGAGYNRWEEARHGAFDRSKAIFVIGGAGKHK
jgi:hypothetical protein